MWRNIGILRTVGLACEMLGDIDAWWGPEHGGTVQVRELRRAGGQGLPASDNPRDRHAALTALSPEFEKLYERLGRPSIAPKMLVRALLLQAFYSVRSERQLMEQPDYKLLFRWFVGLGMDAPIWNATVFT
jgi:hypothetical protein